MNNEQETSEFSIMCAISTVLSLDHLFLKWNRRTYIQSNLPVVFVKCFWKGCNMLYAFFVFDSIMKIFCKNICSWPVVTKRQISLYYSAIASTNLHIIT